MNVNMGQSVRIIYPSDAEYERVGKPFESLQTGRITSVEVTLRRTDGLFLMVTYDESPGPNLPKATVRHFRHRREREPRPCARVKTIQGNL
jgi:hypothetical protein